ncbi:DNA gyrase subunit A [Desulfurispirillum indicum]|uniref:DNA gyrase subunit A n=1 Tax=Desulfurispirillum indicum (strain ATCC BAA-1389 / DSM 22839 / S5) TaxID=653733 RepID=E6W0A6_DESIS|nr:DNA gyrase subunit A [Desulfurispirillum indicum]ADU66324.1 DNA gyrase, A subunit [Desulfurispirillum indicum S5]UCZ55657.1 DNA gyrase subunit A [Desulfurispirillum indicum]
MSEETLFPEDIQVVDIKREMESAYIDYAMSVIVGRALPDVRDGLKPVHRRVLFAMHELGVAYNKPYKKSARIVGDVIGKYHPHGDSAVYDTIVRMVQDFSLRYPLIDGQGNFGSVDGDSAAAMRYTEVRLKRISDELLTDLEKNTVEFQSNYDDTIQEPKLLPARIPNLLINGSSGIAVGMATNIPPHNLGEVVDGLLLLLDKPEADIAEIMQLIKGPDFPTAGFITGKQGIIDAYRTGRGRIRMRARAQIETSKSGRETIIVTEIPYQVNKSRLLEKIVELVKEKRIEGIADLRDESDREGMRIVVEIKRGEHAESILNRLYKFTPMEGTFGVINLALVNNSPRVLNLKEILEYFIEHRREIVIARIKFELANAIKKAHILEGLKVAIENLDEVIERIRASATGKEAKEDLIARFQFSDEQAQAILDMRLQRLTGLEIEKIIRDYEEVLALIDDLQDILANDSRVIDIIRTELHEIREKYADPRRTIIIDDHEEIDLEDLIADEPTVITLTNDGYVKRTPADTYKSQHRGGKGKVGLDIKEGDFVTDIFVCSTHEYLMIFTDRGRVYWIKAYNIPEQGRNSRGKAIVNFVDLEKDEKISTVFPVREFSEDKFLLFITKNGIAKKTPLSEYANIRKKGVNAINLDDDDELIQVMHTNGSNSVMVTTRFGASIHFEEQEVRAVGRVSRGVKGITLVNNDYVVSAETISKDIDPSYILTVTDLGYGKRTITDEYRLQSRGGKGNLTIKTTTKNGLVVRGLQVVDGDEILLLSKEGKIIRLDSKHIRITGRNTQGVKLVDLSRDDRIISVAVAKTDDEEEAQQA